MELSNGKVSWIEVHFKSEFDTKTSLFSAETTETEEEEREERVNPKTSVEKQPEELFNKGVKVPPGHKTYPPGPNSFGGIVPLYPPRPDFPYGPGHNRAPFPQRPGFGPPMRGPYFMPRPGFGPLPPGMRPGMLRPDMRPHFDPSRPRQQMPMYRGPMGPYPPNIMPPGQLFPPGGPSMQPPGPVIPKKVLINPNFKGGGLEAATSEFFKIL